MTDKFNRDVKLASYGEAMVWRSLSESENTINVIDVRKEKRYQKADVDFIVQLRNKSMLFVEVKLDTEIHRTGNIAYEKESRGKAGCFERTEADYIYYYDSINLNGYVLDTKKLRQLANSGMYSLIPMGENGKGYLIPLEDAKTYKVIVYQWSDYRFWEK